MAPGDTGLTGAPGRRGDRGSAALEARALPEAARYWQERYVADGRRVWGDGPSELARLAVARLRPLASPDLSIVDLGCGYGRDTVYLSTRLGCRVLGVDPAPAAIARARETAPTGPSVTFAAADAAALAAASPTAFDVVYAANVYHLLRPPERRAFVAAAARLARPGALLFLSTLAPGDPQHWAVGRPVPGEENSRHDHVYLHFATRSELIAELAAFDVLALKAREYDEPNPDGRRHRHRSWFLEARAPAGREEVTRDRDATSEDLAIVATWVASRRECLLWAGPGVTYPFEAARLAEEIGLHRSVNVALDDRNGLAAFGQAVPRSREHTHIARVIVRPDARGRGIGRDLVLALLARSREAGFSLASLNVYPENGPATALYAALGFRPRERPRDDAPSPETMFLERRL